MSDEISKMLAKDTYARRGMISNFERYEPFTQSFEYRMLAAEYPDLVSDFPQ